MKKLRIAQIAPLWIPVPPRTYGGIELMLSTLTEELVRRGHEVTLFASGDSFTGAKLVPVVKKALWRARDVRNPHAPIIQLIKEVYDRRGEFDIIHNHFNFFPFPLSLHKDLPPILTTVHRPIDEYYADVMRAYSEMKYCAISEDHRQSIESFNIPVVGTIPNGVDPERYEYNEKPEDYLLYIGRLNSQKGVVDAIDVAKKMGERLLVAGNSAGMEEQLFFMRELEPLLNDDLISFRGQVNFPDKVSLFKNAKALLFPIHRREPFGLVMIEAMACGTPVIAYRSGSVPEVIEHGRTGFIVDSKEEMMEAVKHLSSIKRSACRQAVEDKFTLQTMADRYEELYAKLLQK